MLRSIVVLIVAVLVLQACAFFNNEVPKQSQTYNLRWLYHAVPEEDVQKAIAQEDFRFRSIEGVGLIVPGIFINCLDRVKHTRVIRGTSDNFETREHEQLKRMAVKYAQRYNTRMLKHISDTQDFNCES